MLIAHLSDLHLFADRPETAHTPPDIADRVRRMVADINRLAPRPDAVLISGDITDGGSARDYALARSILDRLEVPYFLVPGNHDRRETLRAAFADRVPFADGPFLNFAARIGAVSVIGLDSTLPGRVEGMACAERLAWLDTAVADAAKHHFLILHHPPFPTGNRHWDSWGLVEGGDGIAALARRAGGRLSVLCGHVHQPIHTVWHGAYAAIAGSPAFTFGLGIEAETEPSVVAAPCAYWLHHRRADSSIGVHLRLVADCPAP